MEVGGGGRLYTYRYTVTTRITCIKVGSDESYFNVSLIVRDKVTRRCPQTTTFEEKGEPKRIRTEVPPLTSLTIYHQARPAHDRVGGQLRGDKECPFSGVTKSGRVWRKVPETDARSLPRTATSTLTQLLNYDVSQTGI